MKHPQKHFAILASSEMPTAVRDELDSGHDLTEVSAQLKTRARQLGFHKVGIVRAEALSSENDRLKEWLSRGYHGEMSWMARDPEQRTDPRRIFAQARSVVVVALNYYTPHQHEVSTACNRGPRRGSRAGVVDSGRVQEYSATGKVSRYAWGDDYHEVVGDKLRELLSWIEENWPGAEGKACVD